MLRHALADVGGAFVAILDVFWCLLHYALPQDLYLVLLLSWVAGYKRHKISFSLLLVS